MNHLKLAELKGTYHAIFSLGNLCLASIQLEKNGLRPYAGPIDWMASHHLPDISSLLRNRFSGFMDYNHLVVEGKASEALFLVKENYYNLYSNHDFFTHNNFPPHLAAYPEIKAKYDRRVNRFLEKMATSPKILFIRTEGTIEQAAELETALRQIVAHDFNVLLINHHAVPYPIEVPCSLEKVCVLHFPNEDMWNANDHWWSNLLSEIHLVD
ncbi:hypothetical protein D3C77_296390 [compost metagenome]